MAGHTLHLTLLALPAALLLSWVWPAGAAAACTPGVACLEATFPGTYAWGGLTPAGGGVNLSSEQVASVTSSRSWGLRVSSDIANGRMTEWDGGAYVAGSPRTLASPLGWGLVRTGGVAEPSVVYQALSSVPATVVSGRATTCGATTCVAFDLGLRYRQVVSYADRPAGTTDYRIAVGYEASQAF